MASGNLANFVAVIGALCCVPLAFIFPGLFHLQVAARRLGVGLGLGLFHVQVAARVSPEEGGAQQEGALSVCVVMLGRCARCWHVPVVGFCVCVR